MPTSESYYRWEWQLRSSPEALWPVLTDTNRFNRDAGLPALQLQPEAAVRRLQFFRLGVRVEWEEEPFEWVRPHWFGVMRRYLAGPVAFMRVRAELTPGAAGGTRLVYHVWAAPRNWLGYVAIPVQIGWWSALDFERIFRQYDAALQAPARLAARRLPTLDLPPTQLEFTTGGLQRLDALQSELRAQRLPAEWVDRLCDLIRTGDDLTVSRLRPYALADAWQAPRRTLLEVFLYAVRGGLLSLQWDVLCPFCRGAAQTSDGLGAVQTTDVHCDSCHIDFSANFETSVELTFRPSASIRPGVLGAFCVGGPQVTPHIVAQQLVAAGETREFQMTLEPGRYRMRAGGVPGGQLLTATGEGSSTVVFEPAATGWPEAELRVQPQAALVWHNRSAEHRLMILERMAWSDQAVTAAEVIALQVFRDLFANEALRPGDQISVGTMTLLFTDLRDSTRLYRVSGDAVAFGRVMSHFDILREAIAAEEGALVKTIGDAVMAVFRRPVAALRAVTRAQEQLTALPDYPEFPLRLKAGIHAGPCVAVTLNDRLDYFGSTVNMTARLEGLSAAQRGLVISQAIWSDPEVQDWLKGGPYQARAFSATLKGFEGDEFVLYAVARDAAETTG